MQKMVKLFKEDMDFIAKISKQGDRYFIQIPKSANPLAAKLKGKYLKWVSSEVDEETQKK